MPSLMYLWLCAPEFVTGKSIEGAARERLGARIVRGGGEVPVFNN